VVRSVLVTSLTLDIGRHMWWPSRLAHPERQPGEATPLTPPQGEAVTDGT
jgi:putative drug exporter of the RND superfamily